MPKIKKDDVKTLKWMFFEYKELQKEKAELLQRQSAYLLIGIALGLLIGLML